jgi:EAL domain-containing protein (putative c-di-GMP-specific phosphodiesterase class I)
MAVLNRLDINTEEESPLAYAEAVRAKSLIEVVEDAVRQGRAMLAFQPVVSSNPSHQVVFYEGLIRIPDQTGRIIPAGHFIEKVEERESGRLIDCLALDMGLRTLSRVPGLKLSVNMSARSIGYSKWMELLIRALRSDATLGERLILEITENSAMLVPELVSKFMADMQKKGVSFAIDDFGSGVTSFRHLKEFRFDILKIDGQFIRGIETNSDNQVLTQALLSIAEHFGMYAVAESVETEAAAHWLSSVGIDCLQGFYFGRPTVNPPWQVNASKTGGAKRT